jgi:hypothetical protein
MAAEPKQEKLSFTVRQEAPIENGSADGTPRTDEHTLSPAEVLLHAVETIVTRELNEPRSEADVAKLLQVSKAQTKAWLQQLMKQGSIEKLLKPTRYRTVGTKSLL